jgi:enamine deaminase RidA (YjgF/YER057c/UK114 family)
MRTRSLLAPAVLLGTILSACTVPATDEAPAVAEDVSVSAEAPEYFLLRPEVEKAYGYTHAVKIGDDVKISGAVSMDEQGNPTAVGDLEQQMKNAYSDLERVLAHYGLTFDDVIVENVFTTDMAKFLEVAAYRSSIYTEQFPTGSWLEVKGLALPEFLIEIELEAHRSH